MDTKQVRQSLPKRCPGCGVMLQTEDPNALGYIPPEALSREEVRCQRCFRIKHYQDIMEVEIEPEQYRQIVEQIARQKALVVQVVDLFDVSGSWIPGLARTIGRQPLLLVGNKLDLLPRDVNLKRLEQWLMRQARLEGIFPDDVHLVSSKNGQGFEELTEKLKRMRGDLDVLVLGATNVGKSTFINRLFGGGSFSGEITTSPYPGTTLDTIRLKMDDGGEIVDTPGLVNRRRLIHYLTPDELKRVVPRSRMRPKVYQLKPRQTLFFGGLARMDFLQGTPSSFVCYLSRELEPHRTKLERADDLYRQHLGGLLSPPSQETLERLPPPKRYTYTLRGKEDIAISGLGWVCVVGEVAEVRVQVPEGIEVHPREPML